MAQPIRIFPFMPGGAADDTVLPSHPVALADLSAHPRFGLKGAGSANWLTSQGIPVPPVNRVAAYKAARVLRLGKEDIVMLGQGPETEIGLLKAAWHRGSGTKGYQSWRDEGWAWMRLSGPRLHDVMPQLCAIDLAPDRFAPDDIAQTRVGHLEAVLFRTGDAFDVLFDITASAFFARAVAAAARSTSDNSSER